MAELTIRDLDMETCRRLRQRAACQGVSIEEEARRTLKRAVTAPDRLGDLFLECFAPKMVSTWSRCWGELHSPVDLRQ